MARMRPVRVEVSFVKVNIGCCELSCSALKFVLLRPFLYSTGKPCRGTEKGC